MTPWPALDGAGGFAHTRRPDAALRPRTPAAPKTSGAHPLPSERTGLSQRPLKHPKVGCFQGADRARAPVSATLPEPRRWRVQLVMINSPPAGLRQASVNHQATSTLAKPTLSSQGTIFTPHPTPPPSSQPVRTLGNPAWTLPFHSASDGLPATRRLRRARPVGVHNTPRLQICVVVILWFDVIKRALRGARRGGRVDAKRCREAVLGW